ncbi:MAG: glycosyltransferase family 4 protein [Cyclobacteriaceae bacterium]|nr:glycosyltransferase family 4 protein [Cyclobacteriaceae bacterium]
MKIAVVLNTSWNIYNFRKGLVLSLMDKGNEVITIAPNDKYTQKLIELGCTHFPVKMDSRGANPLKDFLLIFELYHIYRRQKPDVILHYTIKPNIYGTIAAAMLGIPVVNNVCGLGTMFLKENLVSRVAIMLYRIAFRFPKKIFFQNSDDLKLFMEKKIVREEVCDLLPGSGINTRDFVPADSKHVKKPFTFLLISRLIYDKGILEYIEAIDSLKNRGIDAKFQLLGPIDEKHKRGIPKAMIYDWIEKSQIEYLGVTEDVRTYIEKADCIVLPSYREGTPKTLLEAASMAKPIVATDVPGCRNVVIDGENGYLCAPKNSEDLAKKMFDLYNLDSDKLQLMGSKGRQLVVDKFDEQVVIDKYHRTISKIH